MRAPDPNLSSSKSSVLEVHNTSGYKVSHQGDRWVTQFRIEEDSNERPSVPETDALTGLRYTRKC